MVDGVNVVQSGLIFNNKIIDIVFLSWFLAQGYKVISSLIKEKRINFKRFIETGGLPSSHSSTVMALVTSVALERGINTAEFAISMIFAIIVMYDAAGVRRSAGKQARILNKLVEDISRKDKNLVIEERLKELLGHTPFEVLVGALLGVLVAFVMYSYF